MGSCYSKNASGGKNSYSTVQMASTKLDDASRLARSTPYSRVIGSSDANVDYGTKRNSNEHNDIKNIKNLYQSNIPRFSSSLPSSSPMSCTKTANLNCNENDTINVVNNNEISSSQSPSNSVPTSLSRNSVRSLEKPKNIASKSCPDNIVNDSKADSRSAPLSRIPGKGSGLPRQMSARYAHSISHMNTDVTPISKQQSKDPGRTSKFNQGSQDFTKSPSRYKCDSHDSLSDFDSGFGNSFTDKSKPEDSDTIKDLEQLELQEENNSLGGNVHSNGSNVRSVRSEEKVLVKPPMYKRELNGKWSFDEKSFKTEQTFNNKSSCTGTESCETPITSSPKGRNSYKMNASENIFSTYASYKGLLSYKKKTFKPIESATVNSIQDKSSSNEKEVKSSSPANASCIPKIQNSGVPNQASGNSIFYVGNLNDLEDASNKRNRKLSPVTPDKTETESKESSIASDDKSDSTENGVLSPTSEVENREFLIDDEISDQPELTFCTSQSEDSEIQSLQKTVTELHALQLASSSKRRSDSVGSYSSKKDKANAGHRDSLVLGSDLGSSCSSIASDDLMLDYEKTVDTFPEGTVNEGPASPFKKLPELDDSDIIAPLRIESKFDFDEKNRKWLHRRSSGPFVSTNSKSDWRSRSISLPLRPPRPMSVSEAEDGSLKLDSSSYRLLCQDLNGVKTMLLRLKTVIQEAETINPFDQSAPKNIFYHSLVHNDFPLTLNPLKEKDGEKDEQNSVSKLQENADLKRKLVLLQQQLEEKDHTIHLLQQQMTKYLNFHGIPDVKAASNNAATQTERMRSLNNSLSDSLSSSAEGSSETLVSVQDAFEEFCSQNSQEQNRLTEHLKEVKCYISSLNHSLQISQKNSTSPGTSTSEQYLDASSTS